MEPLEYHIPEDLYRLFDEYSDYMNDLLQGEYYAQEQIEDHLSNSLDVEDFINI